MSLKRAVYLSLLLICGWSHGLSGQEGYFSGADGVRLFYRLMGTGRDTVVVIHGGPGTGMREGLELEEGLSRLGHAVLFYDQRGSGNSELVSTASRLAIASHVADLEALRRHFRLGRLSIIGLSWGAAVGLHYGITYPASLARIVFLGPMPPTGRHFVQRFVRLDSLRTPATRARLRAIDSLWMLAPDSELPALCRESYRTSGVLYQAGGDESRAPIGDVCDYPADVLRHRRLARVAPLTALGAEFDFAPALQRLSPPALVIEGEQSKIPLDATRLWASLAQDSRLLLVPGAGHRTWLDRPDYLVQAIDRFLRGDWPDGATRVEAP
jgi:pimeloyl-ACP methyl ester carboxylesterase